MPENARGGRRYRRRGGVSDRRSHPSTLHLWWARRPLAAARAVIFSQMVNDPGYERALGRGVNKKETAKERERLFEIIRKLVLWENTTNEEVLEEARAEIRRSWRETCHLNRDHPEAATLFDPERLPAFHDPFAGGGALPLEAQRLGLETHASDPNPVAVLINKAMIEIPPKFAGRPPVNPGARNEWRGERNEWGGVRGEHALPGDDGLAASAPGRSEPNADNPPPQVPSRITLTPPASSLSPHSSLLFLRSYRGAQGLAEDVRYYGKWMRDEAEKRIGHLYLKIEITEEMVGDPGNPRPDLKPLVGRKLTVIAWIWARTVKSPNPAFSCVDVPLASTFMLCTKIGKEAHVEPVIEKGGYRFTVKVGKPKDPNATTKGGKFGGSHSSFLCLMSAAPMPFEYLRSEARAGRMGTRLMAIVAEGERGRVYLPPMSEHDAVARGVRSEWKPDLEICHWPGRTNVVEYGLTRFGDLSTARQLMALTTFSDLAQEVRQRVNLDALAVGLPDDSRPIRDGGTGATAYAEAVGVYLALAVSKLTVFLGTQAKWRAGEGKSAPAFGRQALPMVWEFADLNPFAGAGGDFVGVVEGVVKTIRNSPPPAYGSAHQADASSQELSADRVVSTDPPYYDNIVHADLSDSFYVWLRRILKIVFPGLFATLAVPKAEELVAMPYRHGGKEKAEAFFLDGMTKAMHRIAE